MPNIPSFTETWGCQMIAYILNTFLYGIAALLIGQYYHSYSRKDSALIKGTMGVIALFASAQFMFISHQIYTDYVTRFNNPDSLDFIVMSAPLQLLCILLCITYLGNCWDRFKVGKYSTLETTAKVTSLQSGATAICDISITQRCSYLVVFKVNLFFKADVNLDLPVSSLAALLNLILFVSMPGAFIFMIPLESSSQLYAISVATMLNTRESLRLELDTEMTSLPNGYALSALTQSQYRPRGLNVQVHTDILTLNDNNLESSINKYLLKVL
ncbi:MAG: hypothetical protein NXY57DRAFT_1043070 [Lentinula lateritia]|nr:MAG: hypothetical protein NXY57DRAFT_1043070 [Lentinula lateritia]